MWKARENQGEETCLQFKFIPQAVFLRLFSSLFLQIQIGSSCIVIIYGIGLKCKNESSQIWHDVRSAFTFGSMFKKNIPAIEQLKVRVVSNLLQSWFIPIKLTSRWHLLIYTQKISGLYSGLWLAPELKMDQIFYICTDKSFFFFPKCLLCTSSLLRRVKKWAPNQSVCLFGLPLRVGS